MIRFVDTQSRPIQARRGGNMTKLNWVKKACGISLLWAMAAVVLPAQTITVVHSFDKADGGLPSGGLVQGIDGKLYGTTYYGGTNDEGTVFSITTNGALTTLHSFDGADGADPTAGL